MLNAANRRSLVDNAIDSIRAEIVAGAWPVGTRVPTEIELAGLLGISRNTVREAVRALAHSGILEVRQGDGTYVRSQTDASAALRAITTATLREQVELRLILDEVLARLAAGRRDFEDIGHIASAIEDMVDSGGKPAPDEAKTRRFHATIADATHNAALAAVYRVVMSSMSMVPPAPENLVETADDAGVAYPAEDDCRVLLEAIISQSPQDAARAARHLLEPFLIAVAGPAEGSRSSPP